jgi:hypothetical protein
MPASGIGPVKRLILSLNLAAACEEVATMLLSAAPTIRGDLISLADSKGYLL